MIDAEVCDGLTAMRRENASAVVRDSLKPLRLQL